MPTSRRTGHIALAGAPNVGKSSLLNRLVGSHLAIVSPKAQSTRQPVVGLLTQDDTQYIFHDLPGLLDPEYLLHTRMRDAALEALERVHVILHLHPAASAPAPAFWPLTGLERPLDIPILRVYTKADLVPPKRQAALQDGLPVSAETGAGIPELLEAIRPLLPAGEFEFDPEDIGTQPVRFFASEYVREAAFQHLQDEVPYGVAAEVEEFREHTRPVYIRVTLLVERDSQKGIVIGRGGRTLRAIGQQARERLEALLGAPVYLDCWVKVLPNWRRDTVALDRLGFRAR
ncbi:MAG TPA: GTPase Era [Gemmatimonadales bacterium]|nr:GTPase Era [Gemmatimonadales bacterium]